ncbi:hypothetical protein ACJX0J_014802, partial [Zea mays]
KIIYNYLYGDLFKKENMFSFRDKFAVKDNVCCHAFCIATQFSKNLVSAILTILLLVILTLLIVEWNTKKNMKILEKSDIWEEPDDTSKDITHFQLFKKSKHWLCEKICAGSQNTLFFLGICV